MSSADAEDSSLIRDHSPAELGDIEIVLEIDLVRDHLVNIKEMNVL